MCQMQCTQSFCIQGHVVAVRITAENATDGFKPTAGSIEEISFRSTPEVWGYFSVKGGGGIHEFSDSQVCAALGCVEGPLVRRMPA